MRSIKPFSFLSERMNTKMISFIMEKKKIIIADAHYVVRIGISKVLSSWYDNLLFEDAENYEEVIEKIKLSDYDLLILDINMYGDIINRNIVKEIKKIKPNIKILIFSASEDHQIIPYILDGADAYINKSSSEIFFLDAINLIFNNGKFYPHQIINKIIRITSNKDFVSPLDKLSRREKEISDFLNEGSGTLEISNILKLHMSTVSTHKKRIFKKLNINNILELHNLYSTYEV